MAQLCVIHWQLRPLDSVGGQTASEIEELALRCPILPTDGVMRKMRMRIFNDDSVEAITAAHPKTAVSKHLHIPSSISSVRDLFSISRLWRFAIAARWAPSPPPSMQFVRLL